MSKPPASDSQFQTREEEQAIFGWIIDSTEDWIWSVDAQAFELLSFNESLRRYFLEQRGISIARGMRPEDLFPAGSPLAEVWKGFFQAAIDSGRFSTEYEASAGTHVLALNLHRLERDGSIVGVSVFAQNITQAWQARQLLDQERRHAIEMQRRYSLILDTIPQSVFWKGLDGRYLGCNMPFARLTGFAHPDEIVGKSDLDLHWPDAETRAYRADDQAVIASNRPRLHIEEPIQHANGKRIVADTSKLPLVDKHGSP